MSTLLAINHDSLLYCHCQHCQVARADFQGKVVNVQTVARSHQVISKLCVQEGSFSEDVQSRSSIRTLYIIEKIIEIRCHCYDAVISQSRLCMSVYRVL